MANNVTQGSTATDNLTRLRSGATLGYAEYGDPNGQPVFFFHGFPGSRLTGALAHDAASASGVRIISPDRPGYGLSDFVAGRTILDWPATVVELADALAIERFAVAGISGGGPYTAACALKIPQRLTSAQIISGVGPFEVPGATRGMSAQNKVLFTLGRRAPWLGGLIIRAMARMAKDPSDKMIDRMTRSMPAPDRDVLTQPAVRAVFLADTREAFHQGARGSIHELGLYARPWGFRLQDITMPVRLWQGTADKNVPESMGRYQAQAIPRCNATFIEGEGHLLGVTHVAEIMAAAIST